MKAAEEAVSAFFRAIQEEDWITAAGLVAAEVREDLVANRIEFSRPRGKLELTAEDLLRADPEMPVECAEYQIKRTMEGRRVRQREIEERQEILGRYEDRWDSVEKLAWLFKLNSPQQYFRARAKEADDPAVADGYVRMTTEWVHRKVVGAVVEEGEEALVVYRLGQDKRRGARVAQVTRQEDGWKILQPMELLTEGGRPVILQEKRKA